MSTLVERNHDRFYRYGFLILVMKIGVARSGISNQSATP
jgi:hypothetical protein